MSLILVIQNKYCKKKIGGVYHLENYKEIGKGSYGTVYQIDEEFVIKQFNNKRSWEMEKIAIESMVVKLQPVLEYTLLDQSKAIEPYYDEGAGMYLIKYPNSQGFTVTEYLSKLKKLQFNLLNVKTKKELYQTLFLKVATSVLNVLNQLTNVQYLHCDIKTDNLMFSERDNTANIRVIDFGGVTTFGQKCQMKTGLYTRDGMLRLVGIYPESFSEFMKDKYKFEDIVRQSLLPKLKWLYNILYYKVKEDIVVPPNVDDLFATGLVLCRIYVKEMDIKYLDFAINLLNLDQPYTIQDALKDLEQLQLIPQS